MEDLAETLREAFRWLQRGCEVGMYPYVIPFSGAAFAKDAQLSAHTIYAHRRVAGTDVAWEQAAKILPIDPAVRDAILRIERDFEEMLNGLQERVAHLPSRVRSLIWILCAVPVMARAGLTIGEEMEVRAALQERLPGMKEAAATRAAVYA
jgi:hypothetical protein